MAEQNDDWLHINRANWDERVAIHLAATDFYDLGPLRSGQGRLTPIEEAELGPVDGLRVIHLQCHFGADTLTLAQRGARVTGVDFSAPALEAARDLARELGLEDRSRFIECNVYDAPQVVGEAGTYDRVFVSWGAIHWLPDMAAWARVVAHFLKPGGALYLAEAHPTAWMHDDRMKISDGRPGMFCPYFGTGPLHLHDPTDYAAPDARLENAGTVEFQHTLSDIIMALTNAGMTLRRFHEHAEVPWKMFDMLEPKQDAMFGWPDKAWLPLAFSLWAERNL